MNNFFINDFEISKSNHPFIIAEAGINHNGNVNNALKMISVAKKSGVNAIKFQTFKAEEFITDSSLMYTYQSKGKTITESQLDLFRRCELTQDTFFEIKKKCDAENILFLSTPQNKSDLEFLLDIGVSAIKVGSDDLTNTPLLKFFAKTNLPMIISSGMSSLDEIKHSLDSIGALDGYPTALLHTTSEYPTLPENVNLRKFITLEENFPDIPLGYSDHTMSNLTSAIAVGFGACIFERHFTLDNSMDGPDHWFSSNPSNLKSWTDSIKTSYKMMGNSTIIPTNSEIMMKSIARRSITTLEKISVGETFTEKNIGLRRPGTGIPPTMFEFIIGKIALNHIAKNKLLSEDDFE